MKIGHGQGGSRLLTRSRLEAHQLKAVDVGCIVEEMVAGVRGRD
jgi:hypothetical protein